MQLIEVPLDEIIRAIDDIDDVEILQMTTDKMHKLTKQALGSLNLSSELHAKYLIALQDYKYVDELSNIHPGRFIRFIPINNDIGKAMKLSAVSIVNEILIMPDGIKIVYKNFSGKHYSFFFDDYIVFQKLTNDEYIIMQAINMFDD